jgi:hypothetical protein
MEQQTQHNCRLRGPNSSQEMHAVSVPPALLALVPVQQLRECLGAACLLACLSDPFSRPDMYLVIRAIVQHATLDSQLA